MSRSPKHEWFTNRHCPKCKRPVLRTRSGTQFVCSSTVCDWFERADGKRSLRDLAAARRR